MEQTILKKNTSYFLTLPTNRENLDKIKSIINILNKRFYINTVKPDKKLNISLTSILENFELFINKSKKKGISEYSNIYLVVNVAYDNIGGDTVAYLSNNINVKVSSTNNLNINNILINNFTLGV